jgi:serine/threonine protein kinase/tetratricopeptide (TPR) repeat protein
VINRRFSIKKKLGQGRSSVYLCDDLEQAGKSFAIKILSKNASIEEQKIFKDEFQTIQKLDHPSIIQAYERGTVVEVTQNESVAVGSKYLVMEYFNGEELLSYNLNNESAVREINAQICSVLFYLHQSNYIYYDLKPENILVNEVNGKPFIKLIDLGFARPRTNGNIDIITGTAEYLAPEILKKEPHDHRVDLYSLGVLLYRLIYKKFPFDSKNQLEIYKAHIEADFDFSSTAYSSKLIDVMKKLLNKNPEERYFNSIQILYDLTIPITEEIYRNWVPIKVFSDRTDILNIVNRYVTTPSSGEIILIKGFEKSGKSAVSRELYSRYENTVLVSNDRTKTGKQFIKQFINRLLFNEFVFHKLSKETLELADRIISDQTEDFINDLKLIVNKVTQLDKIILLLDDFNLYDNFVVEITKEIFPIFQVNGWNIILTEKSDLDYVTGFINNSVELNLSSFTADQTEELLKKTYSEFFPIQEVLHLIMLYADLLPGNIMEFLGDIVLLKIVQFDYNAITVLSEEESDKYLQNFHEEIYNIRCQSLSPEEIEFTELLSSFEILPTKEDLIQLSGFSEEELSRMVDDLQRKNILQSQSQTGLIFSSDGIKSFIYSRISDHKKHHGKIAEIVRQKIPHFSKLELARHYQICEKYDEAYSLLLSEAEEAERISAFKYERNIFEQLLKMPLNAEHDFNVKYKLSSLYDTLNDFQQTYSITSDLLETDLANDIKNNLLMLQGNALIRIGEVERGIKKLKLLLPAAVDEKKKVKLLLDIAGAEIDINNYESVSEICQTIINSPSASHENKGDAYNLLGIMAFQKQNDLDSARIYFDNCLREYEFGESFQRIAAAEINIGNIYNMRGELDKVEKHWNRSLEISTALGNFYHQGQLLLNFGIYHFNKQDFDSATQSYKKAALLFNTLGDRIGLARSESNLGEVYLFICEYQNAMDVLNNALETFQELQNTLEESETLFLIGKLCFRTGDYTKLLEIITRLNKLSELSDSTERMKLHLKFLQSIHQLEVHNKIEFDKLIKITENYLIQAERVNYFDAVTILIYNLLIKNETEKVSDLLFHKDFIETCDANVYMKAERLYLIGKYVSANPSDSLETPVHYFNEALDLMSELNVNETTSKIIFELSNYYFERGNILKAKEFAVYGKSLINFFSEKFREIRMQDIYSNSSYRKSAWEKFTEILNFE